MIQDTIQKYIDKYISDLNVFEHYQVKQLALQLGLSSTFVYCIYRIFIYNLYIHPANRIPGPKIGLIPFMGNVPDLLNEKEAGECFKKWAKKYGGIYTYHDQWNQPRIAVTDPNILRQILTYQPYDFTKPPKSSKILRRILGNGLLLSENETHRFQRKMLNPAFSVNSIRSMVPLMATPAFMLRDKWLNDIKSTDNKIKDAEQQELTEIEVSTGLSLATLDIIGWVFGQDFKSLEYYGSDKQSKLSQAYLQIFSSESLFMTVLTLVIPFFQYFPTKRNIQTMRNLKWLDQESLALVQAGIDRTIKEKIDGNDSNHSKDLLDIIINLKDEETNQNFTIEEIKSQCLTFLAAGHETTSVSLSWCLWLLAQHQKIQDELRKEVNDLFKQDDTIPTFNEINSLPLLNNVVRETLRLIPAVPVTNRVTQAPIVLGSYALPKGTIIFLPLIFNHHSKEIWGEDAEEFNPDRWYSNKVGNTYQYLPFLAGARQCIGYKFALVEFKIILAILIRKLQFFEKPGFTFIKIQQLTLRPVPKMRLLVKAL